jgi:hypothetical protein
MTHAQISKKDEIFVEFEFDRVTLEIVIHRVTNANQILAINLKMNFLKKGVVEKTILVISANFWEFRNGLYQS